MPERHLPTPIRLAARVLVATAVVLLGTAAWLPSPVTATTASTQPGDDAPFESDTTEVDTAPDTTGVDETVTDTETPDDEVVVGEDPDTGTGDVALIAVVGLVAVLSLAAWWMVRRDDDRPVPDPGPPPSEVI